MAHVYWTGWVDADKFHHDAVAFAGVNIAKLVAGLADGLHLLLQPGFFQVEIYETRWCGLNSVDDVVGRNMAGQ